MSHSPSPVTIKDVPAIVEARPLELSWAGRFGLIVLMVIGVLAFIQGIIGDDPQHAWTSLHVNFTYWLILAAAASCFSAVLHICDAQWSRPIRRIFESSNAFFSWCPLILVILYFGRHYLFVWAHEEIPGKEAWLSPNFVYARDILGLVVLAFLARKIVHLSVRRDIGAIRSGLTGVSKEKTERWQDAKYDRYVVGWNGDAKEEIEKTTSEMGRLSPVIIIAYALIMSLVANDQIMSVDPHWYSTMFGGFVFMSGVYLAMAWCSIGVELTRSLHPIFIQKIERRTLHDLGKLLFGFGIFWAYLFWSHYLPIWYGNLPEETGWVIIRLREDPWHTVSWIVLGYCFFIPFLLGLSRDVKQIPALLFITAVIPACGIWLQQYLLFAPSHFPDVIPLSWMDVAISLGFMGAFLFSASQYLYRVPLMPFGDFYRD